MSSINERIQNIVDEMFSGNVSEFERMSCIKPHTVKNIVGSRQTKPSYDILESIIRNNVQISSDWLLIGQGPMLKAAPSTSVSTCGNSVRSGNLTGDGVLAIAGGGMIVPSHYAAQKKEAKLVEAKMEALGLRQENERLKVEVNRLNAAVDKSNKAAEVLHDQISTLQKENSELHKQLLEEKERVIKILMEKK